MKKILVIGDLNVDLIFRGLPSLPILGKEILGEDYQLVLGGSCAITAGRLAGLGGSVDFFGKLGQDVYGDFLLTELQRLGVGTSWVIRDDKVRTGITVSLTYPQDRALFTYLGSNATLCFSDIEEGLLTGYDHLHTASPFLLQALRPDLSRLFRRAKELGLSTSFDTGWDPEERWGEDLLDILRYVDIFLPNEVEALTISGVGSVLAAAKLLARYARMVVVKQGAKGALTCVGERHWLVPGYEVEAVDTTGAGDSFNAGFLFAHVLLGRSIEDSLRFANACGAIAVMTVGGATSPPTAAQVEAFMRERELTAP